MLPLKKHIFLVYLLFISTLNCFSQTEFITTWETTTASESITIPTNGGGYSYNVDWGDGSVDTTTYTANATHVYATAGTYTVTITGTFNRIFFNNSADSDKILSIEQWGTNQVWSTMVRAFDGCANLVNNATDVPDLSSCVSTLRMFRDATSIGTGSATNWNSWDLSNVTNIAQMFRNCPSFNQNIASWNVSGVTNFNHLFRGASTFNQDISGWTTTSATSMNNTFRDAADFDQDISGWVVSGVTSMNNTFRGAAAFDQDISGWDVSGVNSMTNIFNGAELSLQNYNALLVGWNAQSLQPNIAFHGGTSKYCSPAAIAAKANMITSDTWTFNDGGVLTSYIWTGSTDTDWTDSNNWQDGYDVNCVLDVSIPVVTNYPIIDDSSEFTVNDLTIDSGASLTIEGGLTVEGNLTTNNGLTLNSGGSVIVDGTSTGDLTYNRTLTNANEYYYVSAPLNGETIEDFISNNTLSTGNGNVGLFHYDNNTTSGYLGTGFIFYQPASTGSFVAARGYGTQISGSGDITFTGTMPTSDVSISIAEGTMGDISPNSDNLIGNPFPSYVAGNSNADASNLLTNNTSILSEETMWFWNNTISDYVPINNGSPAFYVAPGQGFYVSSTSSGGTFNILESLQNHQTTDVFYKGQSNPFRIKLNIKNSSNQSKFTEVYYIENTTIQFDNGYDSSKLNNDRSLDIFTPLLSDIESKNLAIQSLPEKNLQELVVPLGIIADGTISISVNATNTPENLFIYLEDKVLNTWTELKNNLEHFITFNTKQTGIGRFYLHTKSKVLNTKENGINNVKVFLSNNKNLIIEGFDNKTVELKIFDILGKERFSKRQNFSNQEKSVSLKSLNSGIYFVQLKTESEILKHKVLLK